MSHAIDRVRIVCKAPPSKRGALMTMLPSLGDCAVFAVGNDGVERELSGVEGIVWRCEGANVATVTLTLAGAEVDVEGCVET